MATRYILQVRNGSSWGRPAGKHKFKSLKAAKRAKKLRTSWYPENKYQVVQRTEEVVG